MADITNIKTIDENTREAVISFQYQYVDGGNESAVIKIDVSSLSNNANGDACIGVRIAECWWVLHGMTVEVLSDADTDIIMMHLAEDQQGYQNFSKFGGLPSTKSYGTNPTGDVKFTTTGAGATGDSYQVVLRVIKDY
jgi:hypothetical protein